jgi:hypothetical protein
MKGTVSMKTTMTLVQLNAAFSLGYVLKSHPTARGVARHNGGILMALLPHDVVQFSDIVLVKGTEEIHIVLT